MKRKIFPFFLLQLFLLGCSKEKSNTLSDFKVIKVFKDTTEVFNDEDLVINPSVVKVDNNTIKKLTEPQKGLLALYSAMGGSNCTNETCDLTTALGLGKQGSDLHKNMIKKYFPNDKRAQYIIDYNCYLRPSGASSFSEFDYLSILDREDTVTVNYTLYYVTGLEANTTNGRDVYIFKNNVFKAISRTIWKELE